MQCSTCKREMVSLFLTQACDYCDYGVPKERLHRGFIVCQPDLQIPQDEYVFRTRLDAERWRVVSGRENCGIYMVYSLAPFQWHLSRGTLREVILADHLFEIFPSHRYEPLPNRAFIAADTDELPF